MEISRPLHSFIDLRSLSSAGALVISSLSIPTAWRVENSAKEVKTFVGDQAGYFVGVKKPQEHVPDLILCDIVMPELDGYGVLTTLRQNRVTAMIPFIFLTAKSTTGEVRTGMKLAADDYLTKPTTAEELLGAIATRLEKQAAIKQWYAAQPQQVIAPPPASASVSAQAQSSSPASPQLQEVFDFIEANYHSSINLSDVARVVGYAPAYRKAGFKASS